MRVEPWSPIEKPYIKSPRPSLGKFKDNILAYALINFITKYNYIFE